MSVKYLYLAAVAAIVGCASSSTSDPPLGRQSPIRTGALTAEEIANTHADINTAYDALSRLRPNWLAPHGAMSSNTNLSNYATVFVDGQLQGDVNALRSIPSYYVAEVHYYDVTQAGARFGVRAGAAGAIEVLMKKP
jgi:hypothetical protein